MMVQVKLFAIARDLAGRDSLQLEMDRDCCVGDIRRALAERFPDLADIMPHVMIAVDSQYATDATQLGPESDVACIPPVSGG